MPPTPPSIQLEGVHQTRSLGCSQCSTVCAKCKLIRNALRDPGLGVMKIMPEMVTKWIGFLCPEGAT